MSDNDNDYDDATPAPLSKAAKLLALVKAPSRKLAEIEAELTSMIQIVTLGHVDEGLMPNIRLYAEIDSILTMLKTLTVSANVVEPIIAERIVKHMIAEEQDAVVHGGYKYSPSPKDYVSVSAENMPEVVRWAKTNDKAKELVKEGIHPKSLESLIKGMRDAGEEYPAVISVFSKASLKVLKVKGK